MPLYIFFISILYFGVRQQLVVTTDDLQKKNLNPVAAVYQTTSVDMTIYNKYFRLIFLERLIIVSIAYFISILTHLLFNYSFNCLEC